MGRRGFLRVPLEVDEFFTRRIRHLSPEEGFVSPATIRRWTAGIAVEKIPGHVHEKDVGVVRAVQNGHKNAPVAAYVEPIRRR